MSLRSLLVDLLGDDLPVGIRAYDGTYVGPPDPPATIVVRSVDALRRIVTSPGELGFARAYVAGDLDVEGDIFAALDLRHRLPEVSLSASQLTAMLRLLTVRQLRPLPPPPEEARLRGRRHSRSRDAAAIAHHYDVSNDFYALVLGPSMTYSCAVFERPDATLEEAQAAKYELVCRKLGLQPGMRLLDVGCGWGGMVLHAAAHHGVHAVGITVSRNQASLAAKRVAEAGLGHRVEIRLQDYRDTDDGPYDAISSIGMVEHVGASRLEQYFRQLLTLLRPEGRLLNHGITRPWGEAPRLQKASLVNRYVFPDGELHEVGAMVTVMQRVGLEVRHVESLREHYARTLRQWVANLEASWEEAVAEVGEGRARVWRLYMAGCALNFEDDKTRIHQVLATRSDRGRSGMPLRPDW